MTKPFFSIVIPAYNCAPFIGKTIDSILQQNFSEYEIIVIDDGSTDNTKEIIQTYTGKYSNIKYFWQPNKKQGAARNNGITKSNGKYIVFFDHDDLMLPDYLSVLYQKIMELKEPNFIAAKYEIERKNKRYSSYINTLKEGWYDYKSLLIGNPYACHFCIKKNNSALKLFKEEEKYTVLEDWIFLIENLFYDKMYLIDKVTILLIDHNNRTSRKKQDKIIQNRLNATEWLKSNIPLSLKEKKILEGHSYHFCSIHAYIDNERKKALYYLSKAIQLLGIKFSFIILFLKIIIGYNIVQRIK